MDIPNFVGTPQNILNMMSGWDDSQEKFRAALNMFFVPTFRPKFVEQEHTNGAVPKFDDIEFAGASNSEEIQLPRRMFDLETGNLVKPTPRSGYCMLSHRWKGDEVTLQDIQAARGEYKTRKKDEKEEYGKSDVQIVLEKCIRDIRKQEEVINSLITKKGVEHDIFTLLEKRFKAIKSERAKEAAKNKMEKAVLNVRSKTMEKAKLETMVRERFQTHTRLTKKDMAKTGDIGLDNTAREIHATEESSAAGKVTQAKNQLKAAEDEYALYKAERSLFDTKRSELGAEVDEMVRLLQKWKSAIKIQQSVLRATEIFGQKPFEEHENRYVWLDTCCINKYDADELSQSLSLMGDWYAQSDFTLVQLEASKSTTSEIAFDYSDIRRWGIVSEHNGSDVDKYDWDSHIKYDWLQFQEEEADRQKQVQQNSPEELRKTTEQKRNEEEEQEKQQKRIQDRKEEKNGHVPTLNHFDEIHGREPEWSERGWTLQELVMSKMTYYVNSDWEPLKRPVEDLGRFYHLIPYICLYLGYDDETAGADELDANKLWKTHNTADLYTSFFSCSHSNDLCSGQNDVCKHQNNVYNAIFERHNKTYPKEDENNAEMKVTRALLMLAILDALKVRFPKEMTKETSKAQMAQAVYFTVKELTQEGKNPVLDRLKALLKDVLPSPEEGDDEVESHAQYVIEFILRLLVVETKDLIKKDRKLIAEFGKVELLEEWSQGTQSTGFATQDVMILSRHRETTVPIDHVYALMGIMGVRFPTFHAEGYAKALSRLLDEIIITHNDVSVFNWTGFDKGSPIRGRSMYPSSHKAYTKDVEDENRNRFLWESVSQELDDTTNSYYGVTSMLKKAIECVKKKEYKAAPMSRIKKILHTVQSFSLLDLKEETVALGGIIRHIEETYDREEEKTKKKPKEPIQEPSKLNAGIRTFSNGLSQMKEQKNNIRRSLNPFGRKKSEPEAPQEGAAQDPPSPPASTEVGSNTESSTSSSSKEVEWLKIEESIDDYIDKLNAGAKNMDDIRGNLPENINRKPSKKEEQGSKSDQSSSSKQSGNMICPNPIIVNNAGIEGVFDIQRVIIRIIDKDTLRRQVAQAVHAKQKISGWCTISTGFASVAVRFSCEKQQLERQLQVMESVESSVSEGQDENRPDQILGAVVLHVIDSWKKKNEDPSQERKEKAVEASQNVKEKSPDGGPQQQQQVVNQQQNASNTEENDPGHEHDGASERLVSRMIKFVQEEDMRLVVGEWVLARFSGVEGAKWFLCSLEQGSSHHFYGHRIATSEIDFSLATPEAGLIEVWKHYMDRKKHKMSGILEKYLQSREFKDVRLQAWSHVMPQSILPQSIVPQSLSFNPLQSSPPGKPKAQTLGDNETDELLPLHEEDSDDDGDANQPSGAAGVVKTLGAIGVLKLAEWIIEDKADRVDRHLTTIALEKTPKILHPAIENLNDNRNFLPAMFHSGKRIHMF
ncbi:hypothetical protein PT974_02433 [Cladobotryum mycophilum]|uniref:Heterokaryon incompatibility domain-containing protein n=1 Tax=Cladobotryum mycophilum TaxID=491253 RepID=A0ABR0SZC1_9HYPO